MKKFTNLNAIAASLMIDNIDTDMLIPKQFLKTITRFGLGSKLFYEMRFTHNDEINTDFILNKSPFDNAKILLSGNNFGCGSSREHAPWALIDFGISSIIAESFADIFYNNCFENGILPIVLPKEDIYKISAITENGEKLNINLQNQEISISDIKIKFEIDEFKKHYLINGLDSISLTMAKFNTIQDFEKSQNISQPWL